MKGLLIKEWFMMKSYCKAYVIMVVAFLGVACVNANNLFFLMYPSMLGGLIPITLLSYDERSHWNQYCCTLPATKAEIVSAKYLIGLITSFVLILITVLSQLIKMIVTVSLNIPDLVVLFLVLILVSLISPALCLPFMFKYGVEKGRIFYYFMIGLICAVALIAANVVNFISDLKVKPNLFLACMSIAGVVIYMISWRLSIKFYEKKED